MKRIDLIMLVFICFFCNFLSTATAAFVSSVPEDPNYSYSWIYGGTGHYPGKNNWNEIGEVKIEESYKDSTFSLDIGRVNFKKKAKIGLAAYYNDHQDPMQIGLMALTTDGKEASGPAFLYHKKKNFFFPLDFHMVTSVLLGNFRVGTEARVGKKFHKLLIESGFSINILESSRQLVLIGGGGYNLRKGIICLEIRRTYSDNESDSEEDDEDYTALLAGYRF